MTEEEPSITKIATEALYEAHYREDWSVRLADLRDTVPVVLEGIFLAWFIFIVGGVVLVAFWVLGAGLTGSGFLIGALMVALLATGYVSATRHRQVRQLTEALEAIERADRA
ncbi:hypothetical protein [Phycicoccus sp.]|uniref:hypothetical protein n=1 Tax=Phycicoccus sp. TaxID=1902410 RepID=UPI002CF8123D|nr:hypothetical protein [Phycicoccus sp.]HMM96698.1 hypothetical protein [Phycicoccus sp.]